MVNIVLKQHKDSDMGGSMRLGAQSCQLVLDTKVANVYKNKIIHERHRHRYEVNGELMPQLEEQGMKVSGRSMHNQLVAIPT